MTCAKFELRVAMHSRRHICCYNTSSLACSSSGSVSSLPVFITVTLCWVRLRCAGATPAQDLLFTLPSSSVTAGVVTCTVEGLTTTVDVVAPPANSTAYVTWNAFPVAAAPLLIVQFWIQVSLLLLLL